MLLTNIQKGGIAFALAILSNDIKLSRYKFSAAKNNSVYTINFDGLDYTINFAEEQNYDELFRNILHHLLKERQVNYIPTIFDLENERLALKKVTDVTNSFLNGEMSELDQVTGKLEKLIDFISDASFLNEEYTINDYAINILSKTILDKYEISKTTTADLLQILTCTGQDRKTRVGLYLDMMNVNFALDKPFEGDTSDIDKEISRFICLCMLNKNVKMTIITNSKLDNVIEVTIQVPKKSPKRMKLFIHDKQSLVEEFNNFRDKVYNLLVDEDSANLTTEEKENIIFEDMKANGIVYFSSKITSAYIDGIRSGKFNYGRDQQLFGSIILNIASMEGGFGEVEDLSDINSLSIENIRETFDNNYNSLLRNPSLAIQTVDRIQGELGQA